MADKPKVWYTKTNTEGGRQMGRNSTFTREEKIAAVKLVTEGRRSAASVANELGVHENTVFKWKKLLQMNPDGAFTGNQTTSEPETEEAKRMAQLERRIKELEAENDFLKKVSAYFARNPR